MTYRIALPAGPSTRCQAPDDRSVTGCQAPGDRSTLDIVDPYSTAIQRVLRRDGLAGYEPATMAAMLAQFDRTGAGFRFVDVGANIGLYSLLAAGLFEPGQVIAFEPEPEMAATARRLADANQARIDVQTFALSNTSGAATLHLAASDVSNSLIDGFKASEQSVEVDTVRLDDVAEEWPAAPTVVKIDVEGHEAEVLAGGRPTIERLRPVLFVEVLNRMGGRLATAINEQLDGLGYCCYRLDDPPSWERQDRVASTKDGHFDWMLTPTPIDDEFASLWDDWHARLAECTPDRNSRIPVLRTSIAAFRHGGFGEVVASLRRYVGRSSAD